MNLSQTSNQQQLKIPLTISQQKRHELYLNLLSTFTGIHQSIINLPNITLYLITLSMMPIMKYISPQYYIMVPIVSFICLLTCIIFNINKNQITNNKQQPQKIFKNKQQSTILYNWHQYLFALVFGYLWSHQIHYSKQIQLITLSLISYAFSLSSICFMPVKQISSPTFYIQQLSPDSVRYSRLLLPLPAFIIQLILDYGNFPIPNHLYYLRLIISLVFLTWIFGWISTIYNIYYLIINNINKFLFGDQNKSNLSTASIALILNSIPIAVYLPFVNITQKSSPYWILLIGSTISSIIQFIIQLKTNQQQNNKYFINKRIPIMIFIQLIICASLLVISLTCSSFFTQQSIKSITIIDLSFYLLFKLIKQFYLPRNLLGIQINLKYLNNQYLRSIERLILRITAGLTIVIITQKINMQDLYIQLHRAMNVQVDILYVQYFFIPFLVYRSYKRALSATNTFSFHFAIAISILLIYSNYQIQAILIILFFPPLPHNFIMSYVSAFLIPQKLRQKYVFVHIILYLCISSISMIVLLLSCGILQFSMLFGLPIFICVIPCINQNSKIKTRQNSLYEKIIQYLPKQLFRYQQQGFYLLRVSKYIILVQIKQQNYGFSQLLDLKGLQVQQVTSCHSKQGNTIDKLVEQTWSESNCNFNINYLFTVLTPLNKHIINVPTQNQIQLTGIIQSKQFIQLFKSTLLKSLCLQIKKITYTELQLQQAQQIISDLPSILKKYNLQNIFPSKFAKQIQLQIEYPQINKQNNQTGGNKKILLPPIKNNKPLVNDLMDLLQSPKIIKQNQQLSIIKQNKQLSTHHLLSSEINFNTNIQQTFLQKKNSDLQYNKKQKINKNQLNLALIISLYHYSMGKFDYFNIKKFYNQLKQQKDQLTQIKFNNSYTILSRSLASAFKITIDKITMGQTQVNSQDFIQYEKSSFLGIMGTQEYNEAVFNNKQDIWTVNYSKGTISIKRLARSENDLYMFKADSCIIKSIWNNLRFQLIYATNDNNQRYSIQTHPHLMRNLWTEACQEPFGYPSYQSGNLFNI